MISSNDIRKQFIDFFLSKGHVFVKSSPVVPINDNTLLFTNAGMNQFKDIFLGKKNIAIKSAVNSQKCLRAGGKHNDLDEVGKDEYHHTFFEMLGNWSFGDYYKKEAIVWAWELLTEVWKLPKEMLHVTVHTSDEEACELWKTETNINHTHITAHGDKDNFWEMGDTGPCGPCSEIHFDRGVDFCNLKEEEKHECKVNGDCHRYIELWNLVFMQYQRNNDKSLTPLSNRFVDTGAGFERLCQVLQKKTSNYDTDIFIPLIQEIAKLSKKTYSEEEGLPHRVIADHVRSLTFAIADGGIPSNEGRGYVLRRILRRAARFGRKLGMSEPFLYKIVDVLSEQMGDTFDEIKTRLHFIKIIIKSEEERFNRTLDNGLMLFQDLIRNLKCNIISGKDAFLLFDTYGFPLDLTKILAYENNLSVDEMGFFEEMEKQKQKARDASNFKMQLTEVDWIVFNKELKNEFVGYNCERSEARILRFSIVDPLDSLQIDKTTVYKNEGEHNNNSENENLNIDNRDDSPSNTLIKVMIDKTPFYAESGGQVADKGLIFNDDTEIEVFDVQKEGEFLVHFGILKKGFIEDRIYTAQILSKERELIACNHTATHLLHGALKTILGDHVQQKGSLVNGSGLRFDFAHFSSMTTEEIQMVETLVNKEVRKCTLLKINDKNIDEAKKEGATALFGEKYGDIVRVVTINNFSIELCGGTHVKNTGEIGFFKIISEASISAGIRRIEAITGDAVEDYMRVNDQTLSNICHKLIANKMNIVEKIDRLLLETKTQQNEITKLKSQETDRFIDNIVMNKIRMINGIKLINEIVEVTSTNELKMMGDQLREKLSNGVGILVAVIEGKVAILTVVTNDLTEAISAGRIVSELSNIVEGKGGGRPDMAMGGGKAIDKIDELIKHIPKLF